MQSFHATVPVQMAARSKAEACGRSPTGILVSNPIVQEEALAHWGLLRQRNAAVVGKYSNQVI